MYGMVGYFLSDFFSATIANRMPYITAVGILRTVPQRVSSSTGRRNTKRCVAVSAEAVCCTKVGLELSVLYKG